jgi:hypothetical protein
MAVRGDIDTGGIMLYFISILLILLVCTCLTIPGAFEGFMLRHFPLQALTAENTRKGAFIKSDIQD